MQKRSLNSVRIFYPKFNREEVIRILSEKLKELRKEIPLIQVVLFGSYAKGNYTVKSDIDLLIVYAGEEQTNAYACIRRILNLPRLELHLYTETQYKQARDRLSKMVEGGVVLFSEERCR